MKTKNLFLLGASLMILAGCSGESEDNDKESEEGMGTLNAESGQESDNTMETGTNSSDHNSEGTSHDSGILDMNDTEEGWINFDGDVGNNAEYIFTSKVDYNSSKDYELNSGAYISYYNGNEFIKTILKNDTGAIEQVEEADSIRLSFHNSFKDRISLTEN